MQDIPSLLNTIKINVVKYRTGPGFCSTSLDGSSLHFAVLTFCSIRDTNMKVLHKGVQTSSAGTSSTWLVPTHSSYLQLYRTMLEVSKTLWNVQLL